MLSRSAVSVLLWVFALASVARASDWGQFRGPNSSGRDRSALPLPAAIGPSSNVLWKIKLPPGHSSPAVVGDRIYLTAVRDGRLLTVAVDAASGKILWEAATPRVALEKVHKIGSHAQPSPAADRECVVSLFGSSGLFCYSRDGKLLWHKAMGPFKNDFGAGSSPILVGDKVILSQDHDQESFLMALDKRTGKLLWKTDRSEFLRGYCTPVVWDVAGKKQLVVVGTLRVVGYDLATGQEAWTVRGLARTICMTPVVGDDGLLYVAGWSAGGDEDARIEVEAFEDVVKRVDKNGNGKLEKDELTTGPIAERFTQTDLDKDGSITRQEYERFRDLFAKGQNQLLAIRPGGAGDVTESHVAWRNNKQVPFCASPLHVSGLVFTVKDGGILHSLDARDGKLTKQGRLPGAGNYYSSPIAGDDKVYLLSQRGRLAVVSAKRDWQVLSTSDFEEDAYATPALAGGKIFLRTVGHLYCFGSPDKK